MKAVEPYERNARIGVLGAPGEGSLGGTTLKLVSVELRSR